MAALPRVVVLLGAFWPDNGSSGPNQSVRAIGEALQAEIELHVLAYNGPPGEACMVPHGASRDLGFARFTYLSHNSLGARDLVATVRRLRPDRLWMNSLWDRHFTLPMLIARRIGRGPRCPTILSVRGECSSGALALKPKAKRAMRSVLSGSGLLQGLALHATSETEAADVRRIFPRQPLFVAGNIRAIAEPLPPPAVQPGAPLRLGFLGRISPVKGLDRTLRALALVRSPVEFTIWGPVMDVDHWRSCERLIAALPPHIRVRVAGELSAEQSVPAIATQDLYILTSASENFGHSIVEALMAGTPVITGLHTPWNGLEEHEAGFNIAVEDAPAIAAAVDRFAAMEPEARLHWRAAARGVIERYLSESSAVDRWRSFLVEGKLSAD